MPTHQQLTPSTPPQNSTATPSTPPQTSTTNVGEVAGGTAAYMLVICCCCPCALAECLILAVFKVPVIVVRRIWRKGKARLTVKIAQRKNNNKNKNKKKGFVESSSGAHREGYSAESSDVEMREFDKVKVAAVDGSDEGELNRQMWDRFDNTGFWRTCSQRHS